MLPIAAATNKRVGEVPLRAAPERLQMSTQSAQDSDQHYELLVQQHVGSALRCMYEDTVSDPLPDRMVALLKELAARELRRGQTTIITWT